MLAQKLVLIPEFIEVVHQVLGHGGEGLRFDQLALATGHALPGIISGIIVWPQLDRILENLQNQRI